MVLPEIGVANGGRPALPRGHQLDDAIRERYSTWLVRKPPGCN
jgi:hypothetical protein